MQEDGKVVDGSLLGDANGMEPGPRGQKESGKWQKPRFTRKALMKCCLVKWIIASTAPQGPGAVRAGRVIQEPLRPAGRTHCISQRGQEAGREGQPSTGILLC
ncbi:hypothetical protein AGOR_G00053170 [Albula goreensis]|uniref:Uncharacterized protein n=1 Tax=Albula goreensis TaxID=1534307 RepID=A0A8T3DZE9_9TELE|nr:hypothetical protein AGOR_G00053170 [Albula goreensis]